METGLKFPSSKLENIPIIDSPCCVEVLKAKSCDNPPSKCRKIWGMRNYSNFFEHYKLMLLTGTVFIVLITCSTISMIYMALKSDYKYPNVRIGEINQPKYSPAKGAFLEKYSEPSDPQKSSSDANELLLNDILRDIRREIYSSMSEVDRKRLKRETLSDVSHCKRNLEHCKSIIESMKHIAKIVNNTTPHLEALSRNLTTDGQDWKSKYEEMLQCIECKEIQTNDSIAFIDESGPDRIINTKYHVHDSMEHARIQKPYEIVLNLLDEDKHEESNDTSIFSGNYINAVTEKNEEKIQKLNSSIIDRDDFNQTIKSEVNSSSSNVHRIEEYKLLPAEVKKDDATKNASMTLEAGGSLNETNKPDVVRDNTEQDTKVTMGPQEFNVTEINNDTMHSLVHPSIQGHPEKETTMYVDNDNKQAEETGNEPGISRAAEAYANFDRRIVSKLQAKGSVESAQVIPTAETIKSSQQLQLTPTMSWMPSQVCFYGPAANNFAKQSAPGQIHYPASSPGNAYPLSQQRAPTTFQNTANQPAASPPNYVQVQAQSVQFLPMQSYPGNAGGPRIGPTGPGMQNFPIFPGHQPPSGVAAGTSAKTPYYCTYIPTPTFQFPAIPGVSEYQRSSSMVQKEQTEGQRDTNSEEWNGQWQFSDNHQLCPYNTVRCTDGERCIPRVQWCDGHVDCNDASDETTCSCRDRIAQERLCDGYFDCPHGEDELGCFGCPKASFSCDHSRKRYTRSNCVPLSQRCDGVKQCDNGKDEMDCNILSPTYIEGKNIFTVGYVEGYLHKNYGGQWYPVCTATTPWAIDACVAEIGPEMAGKPEINVHIVPKTAYQGPYLADVNGEIKTLSSCDNKAVYVRCPQITCGTRVFTNQDSLPSDIFSYDLEPYRENRESQASQTDGNKNNDVEKLRNSQDKNSSTESNPEMEKIVGTQWRVVGGRQSQPKAWPFLVTIYKDGHFHCGGVILNERWILTAAHCLDGYSGHYYEIQAGILRRFSFSPMGQSRKAKYTIVHPQYHIKDMKNDIGMIMLDEKLHFNRWVRPVCLPQENVIGSMWRQGPEPNSTCVAIGWGATRENGPDPDHLREVDVPILSHCKHRSDRTDAAICAGYPQGGRDACQGDSGGPLMCRNPYLDSQWYVAGIVSHGDGCGRPNEPGVYTKVSHFVDWIQHVTSRRGASPFHKTPLERCPGFSCEGGLGKCLPIDKRCNQLVDCLYGEDELNCPSQIDYTLFRQSNSDIELVPSTVEENSIEKSSDIIAKLTDTDTRISYSNAIPPKMQNNDTEFIELESANATDVPIDIENTNSTETVENSPVMFVCQKLLQSIPISKRCNRVFDCEDGTDEVNCTCKDFLLNARPTAICDGYLDCRDLTDEENCKKCSSREFHCRMSKTCIPLEKMCDGKFDCPQKEDELDCFALTDGRHIYMDADKRPFLNVGGILARYIKNSWQPVCHRPRLHLNKSTTALLGRNMCEYFGFVDLQASQEVVVRHAELETIFWDKENETPHDHPSEHVSFSEEEKTCFGLYIHCRPVLNSTVSTHAVVDPRTGTRTYLWPWLAAIFVDGAYRCSAILLDREWLLSSTKCIEDVRLKENYTTAVLGYSPSYRYVDGPHQQISTIDDIQLIKDSVSAILHLKTHVNMTRYVQPLFLEKKIYPPTSKDTCVAVGTDTNFETNTIFLQPVLEDCQICQRCFINTSISDCLANTTSDWCGTIFCQGQKGWYPAAVFNENNGSCSFRNVQTMSSIDSINSYLMQAAEDNSRSLIESQCDGFRCNLGQCIPRSQICDGVQNCRDAEDENPKYCQQIRENCDKDPHDCKCSKSEMRCGNGKCIEKSAFCEGNVDCANGEDEPIKCTCAAYLKLTAPERLCDGVRHCLDKTDESPDLCSCKDTSFKCKTATGNYTCIPQDFVCDGEKDCSMGEDEEECISLKKSANDSSAAGEIIRRSYGVWHSECFAEPITTEKASNLCKTLGYATGNVNNETGIFQEPMLPLLDQFYIVRLHKWLWMAMRDDKPLTSLFKPKEVCNRAFVKCY